MLWNLISSESKLPNLIIEVPKGDTLTRLYNPLKKRGYDIKFLNNLGYINSIPYNPLSLIIKDVRLGNINNAIRECNNLATDIFNTTNKGKNKFFYIQAKSLFCAIVFSMLYIANHNYYSSKSYFHDKKNTWNKINMFNCLQLLIQLGGKSTDLNINGITIGKTSFLYNYFIKLIKIFKKLKKISNKNNHIIISIKLLNYAIEQFEQVKIGGNKILGSIFSTFLDKLRFYQEPTVAKMTSFNDYNPEKMGFNKLLRIKFNPKCKYQILSVRIYDKHQHEHEFFKTHLTEDGIAKIPIKNSIRYDNTYIKLTIFNKRTRTSTSAFISYHINYYSIPDYLKIRNSIKLAPKVANLKIRNNLFGKHVINKYTKEKQIKNISINIVKDKNNLIDKCNILYNPHPKALFITSKINDLSNSLSNFLINQTFNTLAEDSFKGCHLQRPLHIILDQSMINNLDKKLYLNHNIGIDFLITLPNMQWLNNKVGISTAKCILNNCKYITGINNVSSFNYKSNYLNNDIILYTNKNIMIRLIYYMNNTMRNRQLYTIPVYSPQKYVSLSKININWLRIYKIL